LEEQKTLLHFLYTKHILPEWIPEMVPVTWLVILIMCGAMIAMRGRWKKRNPGKFQAFLEFVVISLDNFVRSIVGDEAKTLTPIIGTFFIYILALNLFGLIPKLKSPTADINTDVALALCAFVIVQYYAITRLGILGYVKHFMGEPRWLSPLMLPIHIIGELARPLSLSLRLFGNIFGEDLVIVVLMVILVKLLGNFFWLPAQVPMMLMAIFTSVVQALVFAMLVGIYIAVSLADHGTEH
jgi:F-type H+-transporting ATPase subunit a